MRNQIGRLGRLLGVDKGPAILFPYPKLVKIPPGTRILVLAPHPDDDVLGCGGTLVKHVAAGASVSVVYLTDGRKGDPTFPSEESLVLERQKEARAACALLGIEKLEFLGIHDQALQATPDIVAKVRRIVKEDNPDLIYLPSFLDNHRDHFETNRILAQAGKGQSESIRVAAYETWTPLTAPNIVVDITDSIGIKENAIRCHKTQSKVIDFLWAFRGLNAYRAAFVRLTGFAEAFMFMQLDEYTATMRQFERRARRKAYVPISIDNQK